MTREKIQIQYVTARRDENILRIEVLTFGDKTAQDFRKVLDDFLGDPSISGVVIDLRGNPGGGLETVLEMLGDFLPEGVTGIWEEQKDGMVKKRVITEGQPFLEIPLAVIVDENSASASEIFAGAIQDYERGLIIGTTSFGKGTVQHLITFPDGSSFKYTAARWLTPNKRSIDGVGVEPDVAVTPVEGKDQAYEVAKNVIKRGQAKPKPIPIPAP